MSEFGKEILARKYKKNAVGMKPDALMKILNNPEIETRIVFVDDGKTDKGYEFATVRLYTRAKK